MLENGRQLDVTQRRPRGGFPFPYSPQTVKDEGGHVSLRQHTRPGLALLADRFNTLRYEDGRVILLDRRVYPFRTEYAACTTVEEVARAIEDMVVQGGPPLAYAAGLGLVLAAEAVRDRPAAQQREALQQAARRLLRTRPTADDLFHVVPTALRVGEEALARGDDVPAAILKYVNGEIERGNRVAEACGRHAADLIRDGDRILTHCIPGAALCWMLYIAVHEQGKQVELWPTETRPYLQGARLTAACGLETGVPVTVITDGMVAHVMAAGKVNVYITAADRIAMDGHVANKVGTLHNAIAAHHFGIPYYVLGYDGPDPNTRTGQDIVIEERDPEEVLRCRGAEGTVRTAVPGARAYYPAFDITPPHLITAIVTDRGVFPAPLIGRYHAHIPPS